MRRSNPTPVTQCHECWTTKSLTQVEWTIGPRFKRTRHKLAFCADHLDPNLSFIRNCLPIRSLTVAGKDSPLKVSRIVNKALPAPAALPAPVSDPFAGAPAHRGMVEGPKQKEIGGI